jgi:hypothetical protein
MDMVTGTHNMAIIAAMVCVLLKYLVILLKSVVSISKHTVVR